MKKYLSGFFCGILFMLIIGVSATILYNAKDIEFNPNDENWNVNNMHDAINDIKDNYIPKSELLGTVWEFDYIGKEQNFVVPIKGIYKIELWGASGGNSTWNGGLGAYTSGNINFKKNDKVFIYIGGVGQLSTNISGDKTGYNGGGVSYYSPGYQGAGASGGGSTDVRLVNGNWEDFESLKSRIMVAAGGGGGAFSSDKNINAFGGAAGGLIAYSGSRDTRINYGSVATGGTQITGGVKSGCGTNYCNNNTNGSFGMGGNAAPIPQSNWWPGGGGGSGYYGGGGGASGYVFGGAGGSSFISGHNGCDAIKEESTSSNIIHTGQSVHYSGLKFTNTKMIDGTGYDWTTVKGSYVGQPQPNGTTSTGHSGNGYARITLVSID